MTICTTDGCLEHYACRLRDEAVQVSPRATPTRVQNRRPVVRPVVEPSWEKGIVTERRIDGSRMPVLAPGGTRPMSVHEHASQRHAVAAGLQQLKSDPHVFTKGH